MGIFRKNSYSKEHVAVPRIQLMLALIRMKLSEQLGNPETRTKKRKRKLVQDYETVENEDYTKFKHFTKKNKLATLDQYNLNIKSSDKHYPNESNLDSQQDNKTNEKIKGEELSRSKKIEDSSSNGNQNNKCSNLINNQTVIDDGKFFLKKNKKPRNYTNQNSKKVITVSSNDDTDSFAINCRREISQVVSNSPKKNEEEKKFNGIDDNNVLKSALLMSSEITNPIDLNFDLRSDNTNITEETSESIKTIEKTSPRKKKNGNKLYTDSIVSESISANDAVNAIDSDCSSHIIIDAVGKSIKSPESELSQRLRKRKKKLDKNSNVAEFLLLADASENTSTTSNLQSTVAEKPLKSCLKKKKCKNKKKKNQQCNENSFEGEKKLSNRSVSFDNNVKIELIENCLSKSILAQAAKNTAVNARKKIKALAYLRRWKENRQNWKFEKLTQSWLLKNMFNQDLIPNDEFGLLLEYIVDLKGAARKLVSNLCGEVITKVEQKTPVVEDELKAAYPRARSVQQYLQ